MVQSQVKRSVSSSFVSNYRIIHQFVEIFFELGLGVAEEPTSGRKAPTCIVRRDILSTVQLEPSDVKPSMAFSNVEISVSKSIVGSVAEVKGDVANNKVVPCTVVVSSSSGTSRENSTSRRKKYFIDRLSSTALE